MYPVLGGLPKKGNKLYVTSHWNVHYKGYYVSNQSFVEFKLRDKLYLISPWWCGTRDRLFLSIFGGVQKRDRYFLTNPWLCSEQRTNCI